MEEVAEVADGVRVFDVVKGECRQRGRRRMRPFRRDVRDVLSEYGEIGKREFVVSDFRSRVLKEALDRFALPAAESHCRERLQLRILARLMKDLTKDRLVMRD